MLLKRQNLILKYIKDYKDWVKGEELASILRVSDRTVRSDIKGINEFFKAEVISSKKGKGYKFNKLDAIGEIESDGEIINNKERCILILKKLILHHKGCNIYDLAESFYVSESSISNDILKIKKIFKKLAVDYATINVVKDNVILHCNSVKRYELMYEVARYSIYAINIEDLERYFKNTELKMYYNTIIQRFIKDNYLAKYLSLSKMTISLVLLSEASEEFVETIKEHKVSKETMYIMERLNEDIDYLLSNKAVVLLASRIDRDKEMHIREGAIRSMEEPYVESYNRYEEVLLNECNDLGLYIERDGGLFRDFVIHTMIAVERIKLGIKIYNPIRRNLINHKPLTFWYGKFIVSKLEEMEKVAFDSNEMSYIAEYVSIFFYDSIKKLNIMPKVHILLSVSDSRANLNYIYRELKNSLNENIEFTCICKFNDLKEKEKKNNYDLVIATSLEDAIYISKSSHLIIRKEFDKPEKDKIINEIKEIYRRKFKGNILKSIRAIPLEVKKGELNKESNDTFKVLKSGVDLIYNISKTLNDSSISLYIPEISSCDKPKFIFNISKNNKETRDYIIFIEFINYLSTKDEFGEGLRFCHTMEEVYLLIAEIYSKHET